MSFFGLGRSSWALPLLLAGCGPGAKATEEGQPAPDVASEEGRIAQQLGEATCGSTTPDVVITNAGQSQSADGKYDHSTCRNAYIVEFDGVTAGSTLTTLAIVPSSLGSDPFGCLFNYAYIGLWQKQGATYVNVNQTFGLGVERQLATPLPVPTPTLCFPSAALTVLAAGDYRVVASSGAFFGANTPVLVIRR